MCRTYAPLPGTLTRGRAGRITMPETRLSNGWALVGWTTVVVGAAVTGSLATRGATPEGFGMATGLTAVTSTVLFLAAFTASALHAFLPGAATRWVLRNRRYLGVSLAVSHTFHAFSFLNVIRVTGAVPAVGTIIGGGLGYAFLYAMTATSFDRTAARLGPRWWKRLHRTGLYYLWFIFALTLFGDGHPGPRQLFFLTLLMGGLALRIIARVKMRRASL